MSVLMFKAMIFATQKHKGQKRKVSGDDYIIHPHRVAELIGKYKDSKHMEELIAASMLHDTLEDTDTTIEELEEHFPAIVVSLVKELTSNTDEIKRHGKNEYLKSKMVSMTNYGLFLKLSDRLDNVKDAPTEKYKKETVELVSHILAHRPLTQSQEKLVIDILFVCQN